MDNGELLLFFEIKLMKFMDLQNAMVSFELPKSGDFTPAFKATKECFQNERRALEKGRSALFQKCEVALAQIGEERRHMQAAFAAADGENNYLKQWICQSEGQLNICSSAPKVSRRPTECSRLRMDFLKLGGSKRPRKREARAHKGEGPTQSRPIGPQGWFLMRPKPASGSRSKKITTL
ncbi:hypothetical protein TRVL_04264 [Trypanosoma vivax]|nr:hypothetical protein TRVL_04264 [Trypanosoma vivax]